MRFYFRTGRDSGMSVGIIGALILGLILAVVWFYIALIVVAALVLAGVGYGARWAWRRRQERRSG